MLPPEQSDEGLAKLVQGNNEAAFGVLMNRYQPKLLRYGRKFIPNLDHLEDALQEIFIKAYQNIESFDTSRPFAPWIYRIAHNTFISAIRQETNEPLTLVDFDTFLAHPSHERDPAGEEEREAIKNQMTKSLNQLPAKYREALILYYLEDLSYQNISQVLRVPVGTVGVRLRRGRAALRKILENER